ncbi:MAG: CobW family GTP-binding protein [Rhizobiaceae bacterium]
MTEAEPTPITVIGGYLGCGKTTLVNHLLRHADGKRLAILVNEFGELQIDADLIEAQDDEVISLGGGCVCCSYGNDLITAILDMEKMDPRPDHIILEASGVALPAAIASSLSLLNGFSVDGIVVLADAETIRQRSTDKYMSDTILRQLESADILLLNKIDLISDPERKTTLGWLAEIMGKTPIIETQKSAVPPAILLRDFGRHLDSESVAAPHQAENFQSSFMAVDVPVDPTEFAESLIANNRGLVRAKGFVKSHDGSMHTIQIVGTRVEITHAPDGAKPGVVTISVGPQKISVTEGHDKSG